MNTNKTQPARSLMLRTGPEQPSFPNAQAEQADDEQLSVWLVQRADPLARHHELIALMCGQDKRLFGVKSSAPGSAVMAVLACGGFVGAGPRPAKCVPMPAATPIVRIMGFEAEREQAGAIEAALQKAMSGGCGGFHEVEMAQGGWLNCHTAFAEAWLAARAPSVMVTHPGWSGTSTSGTPLSHLDGASNNPSFRAEWLARHLRELPAPPPAELAGTPLIPAEMIPTLMPPLSDQQLQELLAAYEGRS